MNVLLSIPDTLGERIDEVVALRKAAKTQVMPLTDAQRLEAKNIATKSGAAAANKYLAECQQPQLKMRASRAGVLLMLIEYGLPRLNELIPPPAEAPTPARRPSPIIGKPVPPTKKSPK